MAKGVLMVVVLLIAGAAPAAAQQYSPVTLSSGGVATTIGPAAGLYLDAGVDVLRMTTLVGEAQVFRSNATELVALGGVRQFLFRSARGGLYAQALFGAAAGYSQRCDLCSTRTTELGLGANVALDEQWGIRVRGDIRVGGSAGDLFYPTLGAGITRSW
jgi:hypothetical protein